MATSVEASMLTGVGKMPVTIIEADIRAIRNATRAGRARSPETKRLIEAVESLVPGKAKAILLDPGEPIPKTRARLAYAARIAGKKLRVATDGERVLFALRGEGRQPSDRVGTARRREVVLAKALELARAGRTELTAEDVLSALDADGVAFGVARPATMVGAVLRAAPEFERTGRNVFRFRGS